MKVHLHKDGKQYGPYTVEQLREYVQQGNFTTGDHACHDGQNWVTIAQVPGFADAGDSVTTPQQDQVVQEHAVEQQPASANASSSPAKKRKIILWTGIGGVATLLVVGLLTWLLGGDEGVPESNQIDLDDPSVPLLILCVACGKEVSQSGEACANCSHPIGDSIAAGKIRRAEETGATELGLSNNNITDVPPLAGLTKLEKLYLSQNQITDLKPLAGLTNLKVLGLGNNRITNLRPLVGLTKLEKLWLHGNQIPHAQKTMIKQALPNCKIYF